MSHLPSASLPIDSVPIHPTSAYDQPYTDAIDCNDTQLSSTFTSNEFDTESIPVSVSTSMDMEYLSTRPRGVYVKLFGVGKEGDMDMNMKERKEKEIIMDKKEQLSISNEIDTSISNPMPPKTFMDKAREKVAKFQEKTSKRIENFKSAVHNLKEEVAQQFHDKVVVKIEKRIHSWREGYYAKVDRAKDVIVESLMARLENKIDTLLELKLRASLCNAILDDSMSDFVFNLTRSMLNTLWLEIRQEFWEAFYEKKLKLKEVHVKGRDEKRGLPKIDNFEIEDIVDTDAAQKVQNLNSFEQFRRFYLYILFPYNKTPAERKANMWYTPFSLAQTMPLFSINVWSSLVTFLCIDKSDEYQLVNYILKLKGTQVFTVGIVGALRSWFQYYQCATWFYNVESSCASSGPGSGNYFVFEIFGFALEMYLVWQCFWLLPKSVVKGKHASKEIIKMGHGRYFKQLPVPKISIRRLFLSTTQDDEKTADEISEEEEEEETEDAKLVVLASKVDEDYVDDSVEKAKEKVHYFLDKLGLSRFYDSCQMFWPDFDSIFESKNGEGKRGGYLPLVFHYDLAIILFCLCLFMAMLLFRPYSIIFGDIIEYGWILRGDLLMLKTVYSLLSFPFLIFVSPLAVLLLHNSKTAYNENGVCVPPKVVKKQVKDAFRLSKAQKEALNEEVADQGAGDAKSVKSFFSSPFGFFKAKEAKNLHQ